jgi:hypothetical protein
MKSATGPLFAVPPGRNSCRRGLGPSGPPARALGARSAPSNCLTAGRFRSFISVMTEITEKSEQMPAAIERFVVAWGEMGEVWGVNRSVSQIHALLYMSERPLSAEDIAERLKLARSNVSTSYLKSSGASPPIGRQGKSTRPSPRCVSASRRRKEMCGCLRRRESGFNPCLISPKASRAASTRFCNSPLRCLQS